MSQPLIILGTGGGAQELLDIIDAINAIRPTWEPIGFLDDIKPIGSRHLGIEVLGVLRDAARYPACSFTNAIGSEKNHRQRPVILATTGLAVDRFVTLVHPGASVSTRARLGRGVWVNFGASISGGTTIGDHVTIGPGVIIGHDAVVEDFTCLALRATLTGFARVGRACYLGAGSVVRPHVHIHVGALVGMGSVVIRDVPPGTTVVGNPAHPLVRRPG
jgi:sugar O-acyltransferase (sialic acid O-acetyltransferase NeuD family)